MALGFAAALTVFGFVSRRFVSAPTHQRWVEYLDDATYAQRRYPGLFKLLRWVLLPGGAPHAAGRTCALTIVGGGREARSVWRRGSGERLWARGACPAWLSGPSTSPLEVGPVSDVFGFADLLGVRSLREGDNYE
jgi:hypothetical protein